MTNVNTMFKIAVVVVAVALALAQNALFLSVSLLFDAPSYMQTIWLSLNSVEVAVLWLAAALVWRVNRFVSVIVALIGLTLLVALVLENFIVALGDTFWVTNTTVLSFGLILGAIFLAMRGFGNDDEYTIGG